MTTIYPAVFVIIDSLPEEDWHGALCVDLYSFIIRRAVCGRTTKNYNKLFLQLIRHLQEHGPSRKTLQDFLLSQTSEIGSWPTDEEFRAAWLSRCVYQTLQASRVRCILEDVEAALRTALNEHVQIKSSLTVEHFLPQEWTQHWPINGTTITSTRRIEAYLAPHAADDTLDGQINRRVRLVQTFGNLTLLTHPLNATASNGSFEAKRTAIISQSALALNRYFQQMTSWDERAILDRGEQLFAIAKKVWPRPQRSGNTTTTN
jgi:hypothetical protein